MKTNLLWLILFLTFNFNPVFSQEKIDRFTSILKGNTNKKINFDDWRKIESVSFYGGGSLLGLLTNDKESRSGVNPSGSLGLNFSSSKASFNIFYSYNDKETLDILNLGQLGNVLMNPNTSGQSFAFSALASLNSCMGLCFKTVIVDNNWRLDSTTTIDATPLMIKGGVYFKPFDFGVLTENDVQFIIKLQYANRSILGDFNNKKEHLINGDIFHIRGYNGLDMSFNLFINSVELYAQFSINDKAAPTIPGFSGNQFLLGVNISSDLIKMK